MGKNLIHGNWKKEKGLTLAEVIISLGLIIIISLAGVSVAIFSTTSLANINVKRFFQHEVDNIAEMYLSYDASDFSTAFNDLTGKSIAGYYNTTLYVDNTLEYVTSSEEYRYKITLRFSDEKLTVSSFKVNGSSQSEITSRSVAK